MKQIVWLISFFALVALACSGLSASPNTAVPQVFENAADEKNSALVNIYDPARNPSDDLQQAIILAQKENKNIMLELGGDWCIWCKHMDDFYVNHADLLQVRAENYVLVKVNVSEENTNDGFLSHFPAATGYPHIYILNSDGTLLHSQNTADLEDGGASYVFEVFMAFLKKWAPNK